jgi:hypothetical protein
MVRTSYAIAVEVDHAVHHVPDEKDCSENAKQEQDDWSSSAGTRTLPLHRRIESHVRLMSAMGGKRTLGRSSPDGCQSLAFAECFRLATDYGAGSKHPLLAIWHLAFHSIGVDRNKGRLHRTPNVCAFVQERHVYGRHALP